MSAVDIKLVNQRLTSLIHRCLDAELFKTALFYAERLFALDGTNHDSRHLLSKVMLKLDQPHSALHLVTRPQDDPCAGCLFMAAKCNEKLLRHRKAKDLMADALKIMAGASNDRAQDTKMSHVATELPDTAIMHCKAGLLAAKASQKQEAIDSFYSALSIEPLLWEAWLGLCNLGATVNINEILGLPQQLQGIPSAFPDDEEISSLSPALAHPTVAKIAKQYASAPTPASKTGPSGSGQGFFTPDNSAPNPAALRYQLGKQPKQIYFGHHHNQTFESITSEVVTPVHPTRPSTRHAGTRRGRPIADESAQASKRARTGTQAEGGKKDTRATPAATTSTTRRSTRLLMSNGKQGQLKHPPLARDNRRTQHRSRSASDAEDTFGDALSPSSGSIPQSPRSESTENLHATGSSSSPETHNSMMAERYVFDLMKAFAKAQYHLSKYECKATLACLERLPQSQQMSPTAMIMVAKSHYELVEYVPAERAFKTVRRLDPYRIWDMDLYSTLLWHLRRNAQLSFLAQELLNINSKSPEAWIAVGNCFSLQKEHSQAMVCFHRAAEMDPFCAYAYTLSGHESLVTDDVRKAIILFETALRHDGRHYNAWYGLGSCYLKTGRYQMAQYHFERAVEIHPANAVLLGCLGMVRERQGHVDDALSLFDVALVTSPNNALVRYRRAKIMVQRGNYAAAEEDLVRLRDLSPSEPNVVLLLGRVYRLQGKMHQASRVLAAARDLDPRNAPRIAKLIEETGRSRGTAAGPGRGTAGVAETSIEGPSNSGIDVSMEGSLEGA